MKKIQQEELVSKTIIFTMIFIAMMIFTALIQKGYTTPSQFVLTMRPITVIISVIFLVAAIIFVGLGFNKNQKYFELSAWTAAMATYTMLLKINYEIKGLELKLPANFFVMPNVTIRFYNVAIALLVIAIAYIWIRTVIKLIKD
jgi:hypothetical protein